MFTGIIEEIGTVLSVERGARSSRLTIGSPGVIFSDLKLGDSISVSGVCLTVASLSKDSFKADVMQETLSRSALGRLKSGDKINLERAMPANGRFGGHMVSGHIDGIGTISSINSDDNAILFTIKADDKLMRYVIEKGSIAIDGISLTVTQVFANEFGVSIIPHTAENTTLARKSAGDSVNLENDMVGKYIEKMLSIPPSQKSGVTKEFLSKHGYN